MASVPSVEVIHFATISCRGDEESIEECALAEWTEGTCGSDAIVSVSCIPQGEMETDTPKIQEGLGN